MKDAELPIREVLVVPETRGPIRDWATYSPNIASSQRTTPVKRHAQLVSTGELQFQDPVRPR
jgi:hypothetical protein